MPHVRAICSGAAQESVRQRVVCRCFFSSAVPLSLPAMAATGPLRNEREFVKGAMVVVVEVGGGCGVATARGGSPACKVLKSGCVSVGCCRQRPRALWRHPTAPPPAVSG